MKRLLFRGMAGLLAGLCILAASLHADAPPGPAPVVPNLLVEVSGDLANAFTRARPIDTASPIAERKGRLSLNGMQWTHAIVGVQLVPNNNGAVLNLLLSGGTDANTTACQGPVCLNLTTRVSYFARKPVLVDENGIHDCGPAESCPSLDENTLNGLCTKFRGPLDPLVKKIAIRVYNKKKAKIESDVLRDARKQVNQQFDQNAGNEAAKANGRYYDEWRGPIAKRGIFPQRIKVLSSDSQVGVRALLYDPTGKDRVFAAVPEILGNPDVALRIEESLLNNASHTMFAGKKFTGEDLDKEFTALLKPLMGEVKTTDTTDKPFSITFPKEKPIEIHFDKQTIAVTLRGAEFTSGDSEFDGWDISGVYKLTKTPKGLIAERSVELRIFPTGFKPGVDKLGAREQGLRKLLEKKFGRVLKPKFDFQEITFEEPLDRVGELVTTQVESDKGWLTLGWKRIAK